MKQPIRIRFDSPLVRLIQLGPFEMYAIHTYCGLLFKAGMSFALLSGAGALISFFLFIVPIKCVSHALLPEIFLDDARWIPAAVLSQLGWGVTAMLIAQWWDEVRRDGKGKFADSLRWVTATWTRATNVFCAPIEFGD